MTSKVYPVIYTQKYWYTMTPIKKAFLEKFKKSYVFLGCLDEENKAYLIPFHKYKKSFLCCDTTKTGWHIRINHNLHWYFRNIPDISLSEFRIAFSPEKDECKPLSKEAKKAYDKGWHKRNSDCLKVVNKIKVKQDELSKEINQLIAKLKKGSRLI